MIRADIVYGKPVKLDDKVGEERQLYTQAFGMIQRYNLHTSGISYVQQGYALDTLGTLPARLIDEHLLVTRLVDQAREDAQPKRN